jgi:uncharacterized protein YjbJ (UPF0337 family)
MESSTRQGSGSTKPVGEQAGQVANDVKQQASQVKDQVTQQAESKIDDQKHKVASQISTLASALNDASSTMRDSSPQMAHFAESAVDRLNQWSTQLERKDFGELVDGVESFARRNPALFVGGAFALGLLGARFLKASAPQSNLARQYQSRYQPSYPAYDYTSSGRYSSTRTGMDRQGYNTPLRETAGYDTRTSSGRSTSTPSPTGSTTRDYSGSGSTPDIPTRDYSGTSGTMNPPTSDYSGTSRSTDLE